MQVTTTAAITIDDVTRTVEIEYSRLANGQAEKTWIYGVVAQIGMGKARYPADLTLWPVSEQVPCRRGNFTATAEDGSMWQYHLDTTVRNRPARILAWATELAVTNEVDQARR